MKKYAKIIDEQTKEVQVGAGCSDEYYQEIGMSLMDVELSYNGNWYVAGYAPQKPAPTHEDIRIERVAYRNAHIDDKTSERSRKQANGTWTADDEAAYLALDAEVTAWIEQNLPYPEE